MRKKRLDPKVFKVPIDRIRNNYYSDIYFTRYVEVLKKDGKHPHVLYQFFPRKDCVVVGIDEALAILKFASGYYRDEEKAKEIFRETLMLDKAIQAASVDMKTDLVLEYTRKKWDLRMKLNDLWVDKWEDIQIKALYDGEEA
ncbi:MAG: nicotinate phosphoribosyltransferase, partial [Pseudothermotoga sp.]